MMSIERSFFGRNAARLLMLFIAGIVLIFGYLLFQNYSKQDESRQTAIITLNELLLLDQRIESSFSYEFQSVNYDVTVQNKQKFEATLNRLMELVIPLVHDGDAAAILAQMERVADMAKKRDTLLEKHKSHKAVALNSMRYIPGLYSKMRAALDQNDYAQSFQTELSQVSADLLSRMFYSLFQDTRTTTSFEKSLDRLRSLRGRYPEADRYISDLLIHAKKVESEKLFISKNLAKARTLDVHAMIEKLNVMYIAYLDEQFVKNRELNTLLYGAVIILLLLLGVILYKEQNFKQKLEELNRTLENRVEEETAKRLENEQILMQQSKLNAMGELITSISHQWRQPLNALGIIIQDIEDAFGYGELNDNYLKESVESSMEHINHMSKTIDDFRVFFVRTDAPAAVDLLKSVEYAVQMLAYRFEEEHINLQIDADPHYVYNAMGLKSEFEQVVMILLNNAIDAVVAGKKQATDFVPYITVTLSKNDMITLCVEDNGIGVDQAVKERIYEPYFTTKDQGEGIGMGLYIAKVMLENHMNATLSYDEAADTTRFVITMEAI